MKLKRFKNNDNKKIGIIAFTIACIFLIIGVFLYQTFALFEVIENKNLIEGNVEDLGDISFTYYLDGNIVKDSPSKDSNYMFDDKNSNCTNNATVRWNYEDWGPIVGNLSNTKTKCHLKFTSNYHERTLNGAYPVLEEPLIPVTIEDNGTVRKADLTTEWYNYTNKKWANAIIKQNSYDALSQRGSVHGATKQDGYVSLDGVDDYIDLGLTNYDFENSITFAIRGSYDADGLLYFLSNVEGAGISIEISDGNVYLAVHTNGDYHKNPAVAISKNKIYTIVGTYDGTILKMYIDGILASTLEVSGNITPSIAPIVFGMNPNPPIYHANFSKINIEQSVIYTRALTEVEIKESFSDEIKIKNNDGLLSYVDFTNKNYVENEVIPEDSIESYFVWIPRYRYKIFNAGNYLERTSVENKTQTIEIEFESKDAILSTGTSVGSFLTHPAFTSFNTNGMWVGKFETGKSNGSDNVRNADQIEIKPNVVSWKNIQVANAFYTSYDYQRNLESHMMKNTEWGAVAYLQHSKYGSQSKIRINNNSNYITGYAAVKEPTCGYTTTNEECNIYGTTSDITLPYNTTTGCLASTTGNISGIYDMAGGSWEYVMGVMLDEESLPMSGRNDLYNSGFNGTLGCPTCDENNSSITKITNGYEWTDKRYYDAYTYSANTQKYERRILGDATGEIGPFANMTYTGSSGSNTLSVGSWYNEQAWFVYRKDPWILRGGIFGGGLSAGIFAHGAEYGRARENITFRVVLSPGGTV